MISSVFFSFCSQVNSVDSHLNRPRPSIPWIWPSPYHHTFSPHRHLPFIHNLANCLKITAGYITSMLLGMSPPTMGVCTPMPWRNPCLSDSRKCIVSTTCCTILHPRTCWDLCQIHIICPPPITFKYHHTPNPILILQPVSIPFHHPSSNLGISRTSLHRMPWRAYPQVLLSGQEGNQWEGLHQVPPPPEWTLRPVTPNLPKSFIAYLMRRMKRLLMGKLLHPLPVDF